MYEDPASALSQRLDAVVSLLRNYLDNALAGKIMVLSLCSGEARDLRDAAAGHPRASDLVGRVIESDPVLSARATERLAAVAPHVESRCADATDPREFADLLPVDVLLLCGIFGNISDDDIQATIAAIPELCRSGACVIWTRHRRAPDLTPSVRTWFDAAGCVSTGLVSAGVGGFAVGAERFAGTPMRMSRSEPLFTFRDDLW
jgi:hypothetical protein